MSRMHVAAGAVAALAVAAIAVLVVGGRSGEEPTAAPPVARSPMSTSPQRDAAVLGLRIEPPPPVAAGGATTIDFTTRPGSSCQIEIRPRGGARAVRLPVRVADGGGRIAWRWLVASNTPAGRATATVACSGGARGEVGVHVQ